MYETVKLKNILRMSRKWILLLILVPFMSGVMMFVLDSFKPKLYEAKTEIYVLGNQSGLMSLFNSENVGLSALTGTSPSVDYVAELMNSENLRWQIIEDMKLANDERFIGNDAAGINFSKTKLLRISKKRIRVETAKSIVTVYAMSFDPALSVDIANSTVKAMKKSFKLDTEIDMEYMGAQLEKIKKEMIENEEQLKLLLEQAMKNDIPVQNQDQIQELHGTLIEREIELDQSILEAKTIMDMTGDIGEEMAALDKLTSLKLQKYDIETRKKELLRKMEQYPEMRIKYQQLDRKLKTTGQIYEAMAKEDFITRFKDGSKKEQTFQVLSPAMPPERHSQPRRGIDSILAALAGLIFVFFVIFIVEVSGSQSCTGMKDVNTAT